ncbi:MAG: tRNA (adenosine(37)-N6)-threonylcarbamoyltransferase complex dimerization subunit type 1 TsaB [Acidobacteria bacterium]|nr:tRNA (adenosine(37)-N6)-threonylcarbamoyltransferase complex dimerization subunit type 1 TsaB [Acidobacteriota bacterium]
MFPLVMLILALDTTSRGGSLAIARGGTLLEERIGDPARSHGERLPGDIVALLDRHGVRLTDIDLYGVAAGPGSFTGLRVGIATVQGLALVNGRPAVGVSALDALAHAVAGHEAARGAAAIGVWLDAQRGEVFSALYEPDTTANGRGTGVPGLRQHEPAAVASPSATLAAWAAHLNRMPLCFAGDAAIAAGALLRAAARVRIIEPTPSLAGAVADLARRHAAAGHAVAPHAIVPIYLRRSDAEIARDRR